MRLSNGKRREASSLLLHLLFLIALSCGAICVMGAPPGEGQPKEAISAQGAISAQDDKAGQTESFLRPDAEIFPDPRLTKAANAAAFEPRTPAIAKPAKPWNPSVAPFIPKWMAVDQSTAAAQAPSTSPTAAIHTPKSGSQTKSPRNNMRVTAILKRPQKNQEAREEQGLMPQLNGGNPTEEPTISNAAVIESEEIAAEESNTAAQLPSMSANVPASFTFGSVDMADLEATTQHEKKPQQQEDQEQEKQVHQEQENPKHQEHEQSNPLEESAPSEETPKRDEASNKTSLGRARSQDITKKWEDQNSQAWEQLERDTDEDRLLPGQLVGILRKNMDELMGDRVLTSDALLDLYPSGMGFAELRKAVKYVQDMSDEHRRQMLKGGGINTDHYKTASSVRDAANAQLKREVLEMSDKYTERMLNNPKIKLFQMRAELMWSIEINELVVSGDITPADFENYQKRAEEDRTLRKVYGLLKASRVRQLGDKHHSAMSEQDVNDEILRERRQRLAEMFPNERSRVMAMAPHQVHKMHVVETARHGLLGAQAYKNKVDQERVKGMLPKEVLRKYREYLATQKKELNVHEEKPVEPRTQLAEKPSAWGSPRSPLIGTSAHKPNQHPAPALIQHRDTSQMGKQGNEGDEGEWVTPKRKVRGGNRN